MTVLAVLGALSTMAPTAATAAGPGGETVAIDLSFADFYVRPFGPRGPQPTRALQRADGQRIRLTGYVVGQDQPAPGYVVFTSRPLALSEQADGEADDLPAATAVVVLPDATTPRPPVGPRLFLTGTLRLGRAEQPDGRVSWVRLMLDPAVATPPMESPR